MSLIDDSSFAIVVNYPTIIRSYKKGLVVNVPQGTSACLDALLILTQNNRKLCNLRNFFSSFFWFFRDIVFE